MEVTEFGSYFRGNWISAQRGSPGVWPVDRLDRMERVGICLALSALALLPAIGRLHCFRG
jgi:hypothetical protein